MQYGRRMLAGIIVMACATLAAQQSRSSWSGVYTAQQATAGEKIYVEKCASCHGADLAGIERAPALAGGVFASAWHGQDLRRLLARIDAMPANAPRSSPPSSACGADGGDDGCSARASCSPAWR